MKQIRGISRRASSFCFYFVDTGGNAAEAARKAGYAPSSVSSMAPTLLKNDIVLELIAAQIRRGVRGHQQALARLMQKSRPIAGRLRLQMLLGRARPAPVFVENRQRQRVQVVTDADDLAMREHAVRFGNLASPTASQILLNSFENGAVPRPIDECAADKELSEPEIGDQNVPDPFA